MGGGKAPVNLGGKPMKELYTKPMSQIDEFKTYDVITTSNNPTPSVPTTGRNEGDGDLD